MKKNCFASAFPGKVVIGEVLRNEFSFEKHFIVYRKLYSDFFESIVEIIEAISKQSESKGLIKTEHCDYQYFWQFTVNVGVKFGIEKNEEEIVFLTVFDLSEFNNLLDTFKELILPSLMLRKVECDVLEEVANLEFKTILEFNETNNAKLVTQIEALRNDENYNNCIVIKMNFDIIILLHKLSDLVNTDYRRNFKKQNLKSYVN